MASQPQHYDLNIPLPTARRKHQAQMCQERLHQLGYHEISFCHTSFGRLKPERDNADNTLPWNQLLASEAGIDTQDQSQSQFGRTNSLGMKVYRRLNIVIEEVSDVSHFFLPSSAADMQQASDQIIQTYDIVSLQPMNEPVMQSICGFLSQSDTIESNKNLTNNVQIMTLEYAVGSKGGYGLPYNLIRKDYVIKVLEAGLTFELNYSAAMLDPKRRQGFLRTLVDFQSAFNGIQKKHLLLNKHIRSHQYNQMKCKSDDFPLLLSSGSRQNYTKGTDEGIMALRSPNDIAFLVNNLTGRNTGVTSCDPDGTKQKKSKRIVYIAEKVLVKAREDKMGMITCGGRVKSMKAKSAIVVASTKHHDRGEASEDEDGPSDSLRNWLSRDLVKRQKIENACTEGQKLAEEKTKGERSFASRIGKSLAFSRDKDIKRKEPPTDTTASEAGGDDLEDGYIAL